MANVTIDCADPATCNKSVGDAGSLSTNTSRTGMPHPLFMKLYVLRMSVASVLVCVMLVSNTLTLRAVCITPRLRVKAYALTTSMAVSNLILAIVLVDFMIHDILGAMPCSLKLYKAVVRPIERWAMISSFVHVNFIAIDRYIAVKHALNYENRVTPTVIRNLIVAIWLTAGVFTLPAYLGFIWPDPESCIATLWPKYETVVEVTMYALTGTIVVFVYTRIWKTMMQSELQIQQQQPSLAAAATSGTASQSGRGNVEQHGIRMLWQHRQLIRKHRATRTVMVILVSFICLYFPYFLSRLLSVIGWPFASLMQLVASWIALLEYTLHAFIYAIVNRDFRAAFKRILLCQASGSVAPETT